MALSPSIVTAPPPPKLIPKGLLGISVWVTILPDKFLFVRPTYRLLADLKTHGLELAQGTLTDGLQALAPLFVPLYEALIAQNLQEDRWHADETRWMLFAIVEGKVGYRWYLWVFRSPSSVVYKLDESRSSQVPEAHFGPLREGILSVDRYSAYKALAKNSRLILVFCWSHVRRDFLGIGRIGLHRRAGPSIGSRRSPIFITSTTSDRHNQLNQRPGPNRIASFERPWSKWPKSATPNSPRRSSTRLARRSSKALRTTGRD